MEPEVYCGYYQKDFSPAAPFLVIWLKNKQTKHSHPQTKQNETNKKSFSWNF